MAIACGETAPLLYTAGFANHFAGAAVLHQRFPYLTYVVFQFYNGTSVQQHYLSYDAALILVVIVLLLLVISRIIVARTQRHAETSRGRERPARLVQVVPPDRRSGGRSARGAGPATQVLSPAPPMGRAAGRVA